MCSPGGGCGIGPPHFLSGSHFRNASTKSSNLIGLAM
jgi:hypothetical protein